MTVVRNMKFWTALRTDKIAGFVTLPYGKKIRKGIFTAGSEPFSWLSFQSHQLTLVMLALICFLRHLWLTQLIKYEKKPVIFHWERWQRSGCGSSYSSSQCYSRYRWYICTYVCVCSYFLQHQTEKGILSLSHESGVCGKLVWTLLIWRPFNL